MLESTSVSRGPITAPPASSVSRPGEGPAHATYLVSNAGTQQLARRLEPDAHPHLLKYLHTQQVRPATTVWDPSKPLLDAQQVPKAAELKTVSKLFAGNALSNLKAFANKEPSTFVFRQFCERPDPAELSSFTSRLVHVHDQELRAAKQQHLATPPLPKQTAIAPQNVVRRARIVKPATQPDAPLAPHSTKPTGSPRAETVHNTRASNDEAACPAPTREQIAQATKRIDNTRRNMLERMMVSLKSIYLNFQQPAPKKISEQLTKLTTHATQVKVYGDEPVREAAKDLFDKKIGKPSRPLREWENAKGPQRQQWARPIKSLQHLLPPLQKLIEKMESVIGRNTPA